MKKFLLSIAAMAMCGITAFAATTTLEVKDATDIKGTDIPEKPADGSSNGQARHFQPLESLTISGYAFTFSNDGGKTEPAYYYPMSTNEKGTTTIRLYVKNSMTITAPAGTEFASIIGYEGTKAYTIYNGEKTNTCTYSPTATNKIDKLVVSTEAGENPNPGGDITVKKATEFAAGEVAFVFNEGYVESFAADKQFGYWMAVAATPADEMKVSKEAIFTIASTDKGYTIKDFSDRFMGWDGEHWSFNAYTTSDEANCYWDVAMVDGKVKISNKAKSADGKEVYLAGKVYNTSYEMVPTNRDDQTLPMLYNKVGTGVENIAVENDAEAVYYNLQGVQVENPVKGLYIVVKGNNSSKVIF